MLSNFRKDKICLFIYTVFVAVAPGISVAGKLFVAGEGSGNIAVVNTDTNTVTSLIDVGAGSNPHQPRLSPDGQYVWTTLPGTGQIAKTSVLTNQTNFYSTGGASPNHLNFSPNGNWVYIVNQGSDEVVRMDTATGALGPKYTLNTGPASAPHGINVAADGSVWVLDTAADTITVLDAGLSGVPAPTVIGVGEQPIGMVFGDDGRAYTSNLESKTVSVVDYNLLTLIDTISVGGSGAMGPMGIVLEPDGTDLWLAATPSNAVLRYSVDDGGTYALDLEINNLVGAHGIDISADGSYIFTTLFYDGFSTARDAIAVIDTATGAIVDKFYTAGADNIHGLVYVSTVPVPAAVWLFGSGLLGLIGIARRKAA